MNSVNEMNAVTREQARIREGVMLDCEHIEPEAGKVYVRLVDVLAVIQNRNGNQQE